MHPPVSNRLLYVTIFVLSLTEFLQAGMTAFAAAPLMGNLSLGPEEFSLIASVYASLAILAISLQRWWVERLGGQHFIQLSAVVSVAGSLLCATSHDFNGFLLGRTVMALGGGAFFTASRMVLQHRLAGPQRFVGIRCLAFGLAIGIAAAPWLAAAAVAEGHWSAMYWLLAALGLLVFVLATLALNGGPRDVPQRRSAVQPWQQLLLVGASFGLLYGLQRLYYDFYAHTLAVLLTLLGALAGLALYLHQQHYQADPLLRVREMWSTRYLTGLGLFGFAYVMLGANNYAVPVLLERALGFGWQTLGLIEALSLSAALLTWLVMSRLLPRHPSPRKFLVTGFCALALSGTLLTRIHTGVDLWRHVLPALALQSVFLLTVLPVSAMQTFRGVEHEESVFSHAQQLKNMMAQAGIAMGIALATVGQQWRSAVHYEVLAAQVNLYTPQFTALVQHLQQTMSGALPAPEATQLALAQAAQLVAQQATLLATIDHFSLVALLGGMGMLVAALQRVFR
ncbi:MFS transporter [Simplicispira psychrophila]|uniref:MFS transporter n=1 Tax=Simplicispira psychrophila TaxID=80882 RepID=UPI00048984E5|nr:MFS transporter [Simplicispira psychrophila]